MKKVFIKTFGCQMNERDSLAMLGALSLKGYEPICPPSRSSENLCSVIPAKAGIQIKQRIMDSHFHGNDIEERENIPDLIIINTCSVRDKAHQKAFSEIGRMCAVKKEKNDVIVCVAGCVSVQEKNKLWERFPAIDLIIGPDQITRLGEFVEKIKDERGRIIATEIPPYPPFPKGGRGDFLTPRNDNCKAMVTIMKGCDNACAFCIVPSVRGPEVSRPSRDILDEIKFLEENGTKEVLLLGQNVNSYGKGLKEKISFAALLQKISAETLINRIRFTSPHPKDLSNALIDEYGRNKKLCPHMHLPVQSGSNKVLKRMRRAYTREKFLEKVERLRRARPGVAVTTDIIVGFPGETEEDYKDTIDLLKTVRFDGIYSFAYSVRSGTEAAGFDDDVPRKIKEERLLKLQSLQNEITLEINKFKIGTVQEVLVEGEAKRGTCDLTGRSPDNKVVIFSGKMDLTGKFVDIEITNAYSNSLRGEICS